MSVTVAMFGRPNHVIAVIVNRAAALAVDHDPARVADRPRPNSFVVGKTNYRSEQRRE